MSDQSSSARADANSSSRSRGSLALPVLVCGALLLGPLACYLSQVICFGLGVISSVGFTSYAVKTLVSGAVFGFLASLICLAFYCRPWPSALWCALAMSAQQGLYAWTHYNEGMQAIGPVPDVVFTLVGGCMMGLAAYAACCLAQLWSRLPQAAASQSASVRRL